MEGIVIDTREQTPLWPKTSKVVEFKKLDVGDYSLKGYEDKIAIERKSPSDLFGSLGKDHARFKRELARAKDYDYFAILVETNYTNIINKEFDGAHHSKMKGYVVAQILFTLHIKYGIPIFMVNGRREAKAYVRELLKAYKKQVDKK